MRIPADRLPKLRAALEDIQRSLSQRKLRSATDQAFQAIAASPDYLPTHFGLLEALVANGEMAAARRSAERWWTPFRRRGREENTLATLRRLVELTPPRPARQVRAGQRPARAGQSQEAARFLREVLIETGHRHDADAAERPCWRSSSPAARRRVVLSVVERLLDGGRYSFAVRDAALLAVAPVRGDERARAYRAHSANGRGTRTPTWRRTPATFSLLGDSSMASSAIF